MSKKASIPSLVLNITEKAKILAEYKIYDEIIKLYDFIISNNLKKYNSKIFYEILNIFINQQNKEGISKILSSNIKLNKIHKDMLMKKVCMYGNYDIFILLAKNNFIVKNKLDYIEYAIKGLNLNIIKYLIPENIEFTDKIYKDIIYLCKSKENESLEIMKYFISKGLDINYDSNILLIESIRNVNLPMIELLLQNNIDIKNNSNNFIIPMIFSIIHTDSSTVLDLLLKKGLDLSVIDKDLIINLITTNSSFNIALYLIEKDFFNQEQLFNLYRYFLIHARNLYVCKKIILKGIDVNELNSLFFSRAVDYGDKEYIIFYLQQGGIIDNMHKINNLFYYLTPEEIEKYSIKNHTFSNIDLETINYLFIEGPSYYKDLNINRLKTILKLTPILLERQEIINLFIENNRIDIIFEFNHKNKKIDKIREKDDYEFEL